MPGNSKKACVQKRNRIMQHLIPWMNGEITSYEVAKRAKVSTDMAYKWLPIFSRQVKAKEAEITVKIQNAVSTEENISIWEKIRRTFLKAILMEP